jgi:hypothetical protein
MPFFAGHPKGPLCAKVQGPQPHTTLLLDLMMVENCACLLQRKATQQTTQQRSNTTACVVATLPWTRLLKLTTWSDPNISAHLPIYLFGYVRADSPSPDEHADHDYAALRAGVPWEPVANCDGSYTMEEHITRCAIALFAVSISHCNRTGDFPRQDRDTLRTRRDKAFVQAQATVHFADEPLDVDGRGQHRQPACLREHAPCVDAGPSACERIQGKPVGQ